MVDAPAVLKQGFQHCNREEACLFHELRVDMQAVFEDGVWVQHCPKCLPHDKSSTCLLHLQLQPPLACDSDWQPLFASDTFRTRWSGKLDG